MPSACIAAIAIYLHHSLAYNTCCPFLSPTSATYALSVIRTDKIDERCAVRKSSSISILMLRFWIDELFSANTWWVRFCLILFFIVCFFVSKYFSKRINEYLPVFQLFKDLTQLICQLVLKRI